MSAKICGVKSLEAAQEAAEHGAHFIGIIMVPGRERSVDTGVAKQISAYLRTLPEERRPKLVGVFRNQSLEVIERAAQEIPLDVVQLHGSEPPEFVSQITTSVIKRVVPTNPDFVEQILLLNSQNVYALVDSERGGDGKVFDWTPLEKVGAVGGKYILAGGLNPDNVKQALAQPGCIGVDVSGGVETDGIKDLHKIRLFLKNAAEVGN